MKRYLLVFSVLLFAGTMIGQNVEKNLTPEPVIIQNYSGNGDIANPFGTPLQQDRVVMSQVRELSKQLDRARENGDVNLVKELENQINALVGSKAADPNFGPQAVPLSENFIPGDAPNDIRIATITPGAIWATATTTQDTDGRIWVATTHFASGATDTLRIFYSDDGGLNWTYFNGFSYGSQVVNFRKDDLDIEVLNDGTDWYIYITGGYDFSGEAWGFVTRYKADGTGFFYMNLPKSSGTDQYWTRVVSDYPDFSSLAYVYISATMDSVIDASTRHLFSRAFIIMNPFDTTPTVTDRNHNTNGSSYWWHWGTAPDSSTMKTDIAYYDSLSEGTRIVTTTMFENSQFDSVMYMTYSDNFMATDPYVANNFSLTYRSMRPILSFNGGNDQLTGCIVTTRMFQNTSDTDPRYIVTNNGGSTWSQGYIDATTAVTVKTDVIGLRGVDGQFKFGWIDDASPNNAFFYSSGHVNGSLTITPKVEMSGAGIYPDIRFGGRAGYRLTATDSCFAVFEGPTGVNAYGSSGCSGPVTSAENEEIPVNYSLSQNYPNPFNPSTSIKFQVPQSEFVRLVIYDVLGKEVATLVNEEKAAGSYEINYNASNLSSGIYFYTIKAGSFTSTKKMILMK